MSEFLLENNVPDAYVEKSRDFQLLCRIIDIYLRGCINRASDMIYQLDLDNCSESLLWAVANMQGFSPSIYIQPEVLRNICKVFPYCVKNKGTINSIRTMASAVFSTDRLLYNVEVYLDNSASNEYDVIIECNANRDYIQYMKEALKYILPTGFTVSFVVYIDVNVDVQTQFSTQYAVSRFSGFGSKIIGDVSPIKVINLGNNSPTTSTHSGYYSKIGFVKLYQYSSPQYGEGSESISTGVASNVVMIPTSNGPMQYVGSNVNVENTTDSNTNGI